MGECGLPEGRDVSQCLKMSFWHFVRSFGMFSFRWYDACLRWWSFFFPSSLLPKNYSLILLIVDISTSVVIFFIFNFWSWPFYKSFIYYSITIHQILYSLMWSSFFGFLIFILGHFVRVLVTFNFILQFKLIVLCFQIWSS
jgi:hypothetical protein